MKPLSKAAAQKGHDWSRNSEGASVPSSLVGAGLFISVRILLAA